MSDAINSKISLAIKSGECKLGYKEALKSLRKGKAQLIIIADNCPAIRKSELEYYASLVNINILTGKYNSAALGTACAKMFRVSVLTIENFGDADLSDFIAQ